MIWLVLLVIVFRLIMVLRKRSQDKSDSHDFNHEGTPINPGATAVVDIDAEEDDLIAVITAAIHEFAGHGDFEVVSIKPSGGDWKLTGRQELLRSRI
jgi:Na+-transporting methylmalonyl-CoA/oxaloacetate decarboxylase gamma subunit